MVTRSRIIRMQLGWIGLQEVIRRLSRKQQLLVNDVCQTLGNDLLHSQLVLRTVTNDALGESVLRVAQAARASCRPLVYPAQRIASDRRQMK